MRTLKLTSLAIIGFVSSLNSSFSQATATISLDSVVMQNPKLLLGITYDCRSSLSDQNGNLMGFHNTDGTMNPAVSNVFSNFPMSTLRYPANGIMQGFEWKKSIGPIGSRIPQSVFAQTSIPAQIMEFGFDEFMAMTASKGVLAKDVQIMVPIYDSAIVYTKTAQTNASIPNVLQSNADWVEYANSPNDGSNPGGGTDWAAVRAANGHPLPYGIEIWNMGNEPYTNGEYDASNDPNAASNYITNILPMIDAMLAIDPSIKISVTVTSNVTSGWTSPILNSPLLQGKIFALNCHFFLTEEIQAGMPLNNQPNVFTANSRLISLTNAAALKGFKVIVGDQAHVITPLSNPTQAQQDIAMQWQGANETADMLMAMSQIENIDRSNFWVYGLWTNQWHPIRKNADGTFTAMPVAELYKKFNPLFLDNSLFVSNTSPAATDGIPYSVRASAFASSDLNLLNVLAVNRDKTAAIPINISGISNYNLTIAHLLTASALDSDTIIDIPISADASGNYLIPPMGILILEHQLASTASITPVKEKVKFTVFPNPSNEMLYFSEKVSDFSILNTLEQIVYATSESQNSISTENFKNGIYFLKTQNSCVKFIVKH